MLHCSSLTSQKYIRLMTSQPFLPFIILIRNVIKSSILNSNLKVEILRLSKKKTHGENRFPFRQRTIIKVNRVLLRRVFYSPRFGGAMCERAATKLQGLPHKIYWINTILSFLPLPLPSMY